MMRDRVQVQGLLKAGMVVAFLAALCFGILGVTSVVSPATAIGNTVGFIVTGVVVMIVRARS